METTLVADERVRVVVEAVVVQHVALGGKSFPIEFKIALLRRKTEIHSHKIKDVYFQLKFSKLYYNPY